MLITTRMMKCHFQIEDVDLASVDPDLAARHLAEVIRIKTISQDLGKVNLAAFNQLHEMLENTYPLVHKQLKREIINEAGHCYIHGREINPSCNRFYLPLIRMLYL